MPKIHAVPRRGALLFVYGTLRPCVDVPMARWLAAAAERIGEARTPGRLYDLGRYPGLVAPRRYAEWVAGDVYRVTRRVVLALDRYEAPAFERVRSSVVLRRPPAAAADDGPRGAGIGQRRDAWLYLYRRPVRGRMRIASGDYRLHLRAGVAHASPGSRPKLVSHAEPVCGR